MTEIRPPGRVRGCAAGTAVSLRPLCPGSSGEPRRRSFRASCGHDRLGRQRRAPVHWAADPSRGGTPLNSPRAGRQQGQAGSTGCARGPLWAWPGGGVRCRRPGLGFEGCPRSRCTAPTAPAGSPRW